MSDINLNLDGVLAFLVAAGLGLLLVLAILLGSLAAAVKANQRGEQFTQQKFFPHLIGMVVSLLCCLAIELVLLVTDSNLPPRRIPVWLDNWVIIWLTAVLLLWPLSARAYKTLMNQFGLIDRIGNLKVSANRNNPRS
jgi:hypothetical protein